MQVDTAFLRQVEKSLWKDLSKRHHDTHPGRQSLDTVEKTPLSHIGWLRDFEALTARPDGHGRLEELASSATRPGRLRNDKSRPQIRCTKRLQRRQGKFWSAEKDRSAQISDPSVMLIDFGEVVRLDEYLAWFAALGWAQQTFLLHHVDQAGGARESDAHATLQKAC